MTTTSFARSTPALVAHWKVEPGVLLVTYALTNRDPYMAVLCFDGARGNPEDPAPDLGDQLYVSWEAPHTVHVKRVWPPLPREQDITRAFVPTLSRVRPGTTREVRMRLALPLRERSQYFPHFEKAEYLVATARTLTLTIGYLREVEGTEVDTINEDLGVFRYRRTREPQHLVSVSGPVEVGVMVRKETWFERV
jgi:hypothetical protein